MTGYYFLTVNPNSIFARIERNINKINHEVVDIRLDQEAFAH